MSTSGSKHPYLDGIEFRLSDSFKPRTKIHSPRVHTKDVDQILANCHYDFSLEHRVMSDYAERKQQERDAYIQRENDRINSVQNRNKDTSPTPSSSSSDNSRPASDQMINGDILKPLPADKGDNFHPQRPQEQFDLNDFETDTNQDPFSNAELNTIDDMKVLTDVLRNVTTKDFMFTASPVVEKDLHPATNKKQENMSSNERKAALLEQLGDLLTDQVEGQLKNKTQKSYSKLEKSASPPSTLSDDGGEYPPVRNHPPVAKPRSKPVEVGAGSVTHRVLQHKTLEEKKRFEDTIKKALTSLPQLPKPSARNHQASTSTNHHHPPTHMRENSTDMGVINGLQADERDFLHSICSMGFKTNHVLRVMQRCGQDHKEVVERLCLCQHLNEKLGYSFDEIDEALELFNGEQSQMVKYLKVYRQLTVDMGFPRERVKQVLLLYNNDQSKALQALMST